MYQIFGDMKRMKKDGDITLKIAVIDSKNDFILHYNHESQDYVAYLVLGKRVVRKSFTTNVPELLETWADKMKIKLAEYRPIYGG